MMNGQLDRLQQTIRNGADLFPPLPRRQNHRVDRAQCQALLQAVLDGREEPLGVHQVARRLGYDEARQLAYHFPEECKLVTQRAKAYRKQRKEQRIAQMCEEVRQAVFSLHAQGIYPSLHKVAALLSSPSLMRTSEAMTTWHEALRELGFEP